MVYDKGLKRKNPANAGFFGTEAAWQLLRSNGLGNPVLGG